MHRPRHKIIIITIITIIIYKYNIIDNSRHCCCALYHVCAGTADYRYSNIIQYTRLKLVVKPKPWSTAQIDINIDNITPVTESQPLNKRIKSELVITVLRWLLFTSGNWKVNCEHIIHLNLHWRVKFEQSERSKLWTPLATLYYTQKARTHVLFWCK